MSNDDETSREIPLTQGKVAIVDAADYEWLSQWKWSARKVKKVGGTQWYVIRSHRRDGKQRTIYMHRQILGDQAGPTVDHRDGNGLNNTRSNLRSATQQQNLLNRGISGHNTSGYKGVCLRKDNGKWQAQIAIDHNLIYLGYYDVAEDAARAYDDAARQLHGKFAHLNFE